MHAHGEESLQILWEVLREKHPGYLAAFNRSMGKTAGHRFNMMIMKKEQMEAYCSWLFDVLFEAERRMEKPEARIMGFLSERLMDAWIEKTRTSYHELKVYHTEKTNWLKKGGIFLLRKVCGGKGKETA